jgi:hypothetical protein
MTLGFKNCIFDISILVRTYARLEADKGSSEEDVK